MTASFGNSARRILIVEGITEVVVEAIDALVESEEVDILKF